MKKLKVNYILALIVVLCLISSLAVFIYAGINMKNMLETTSKQRERKIVTKGAESNSNIQGNYTNNQVYVFSRNVFAILVIIGVITAILTFLLAKRIFGSRVLSIDTTIDRERELKAKNIELENIVKQFEEK